MPSAMPDPFDIDFIVGVAQPKYPRTWNFPAWEKGAKIPVSILDA